MLTGREHFYPVFRSAVESTAGHARVLDIGTPQRFHKELAPFAGRLNDRCLALGHRVEHTGTDADVDVEGDIRALPFRPGSADSVLCLEVIEHVPEAERAVREIRRVLRPGGHLVLTTPFMLGYHGKRGAYGDFHRFTEDGLRWLLRDFSTVEVLPLGGLPYRLLHTLVPARVRDRVLESQPLMRLLNALDRRLPTRNPLRWLAVART